MREENAPLLLPYLTGSLGVWTLMDYIGESHAWPNYACSYGQFDIAGSPKPHAYWYHVNWLLLVNDSDAGRPPVSAVPGFARLLDIVDDLPTDPKNKSQLIVSALSTGNSTELLVNGVSKGLKSPQQLGDVVNWTLPTGTSMSGTELRVVARDATGDVVGTDRVTKSATGQVDGLRGTLDVPSLSTGTGSHLILDGLDTALVRITTVDSQQRLVSTAPVVVTFEVLSGPGVVVGVGSGDPASHSYQQGTTASTYGGTVKAVVRVNVDCTSPGRGMARAIDADTDAVTKVVPEGSDCGVHTAHPIILRASTGNWSTTVAIPVSDNVAVYGYLAAAMETAARLEGYTYLNEFRG